MADNRVVIKINYDKDKQRKALIDPKMVTVWHTGRILTAVFILVLLILMLFYLFATENADRNTGRSNEINIAVEPASPETPDDAKTELPKAMPAPSAPAGNIKGAGMAKPPAIIFDRRVIRASLNTEPKQNEPGQPIEQSIVLSQNQTRELFYFSQIKNLKANTLYHAWYKEGQLINKHQFDVKTNNDRLISSRKLTVKDVGEWQVALIDSKGKKFSVANFSVNH